MAKIIITLEDNPDGESFSAHFNTPPHGEECTPICHALYLIMQVLNATHDMGEAIYTDNKEVRH